MASHKLAIGQTLRFSPGLGEDSRRKGRYKVVDSFPRRATRFNTASRARQTAMNASFGKTRSSAGN
jgi:hypothetical protein